jgi:hypothetical protein
MAICARCEADKLREQPCPKCGCPHNQAISKSMVKRWKVQGRTESDASEAPDSEKPNESLGTGRRGA